MTTNSSTFTEILSLTVNTSSNSTLATPLLINFNAMGTASGPSFPTVGIFRISVNGFHIAGQHAIIQQVNGDNMWTVSITQPYPADFSTIAPPGMYTVQVGWRTINDSYILRCEASDIFRGRMNLALEYR